jgi:hypothetical protein
MKKSFDRQAAARYAIKYALNHNPEWPSDAGLGGDCTNFVSQALYAGGWTMIRRGTILGSERDGGSWYSGRAGSSPRDRSRTWAAAANFAQFLQAGGRARRCAISELALADVVQLKRFNTIYHTVIVTGMLPDSVTKKSMPFVTYHSRDVLQRPLSLISTPEATVCWKILDSFEADVPFIMPRAG